MLADQINSGPGGGISPYQGGRPVSQSDMEVGQAFMDQMRPSAKSN